MPKIEGLLKKDALLGGALKIVPMVLSRRGRHHNLIEMEDYPRLNVVSALHLHVVKKYAIKAHESVRLADDLDGRYSEEYLKLLQEEYISILNYSASRVFANGGAMMMAAAFDQWDGIQFSDDTRMIAHGIVHSHYRSLWSNNPQAYATIQDVLQWCKTVNITTTAKTLRIIIDNGIQEGMYFHVPTFKGNEKAVAPTLRMMDMYQASVCLYASLLGTRWLNPLEGQSVEEQVSRMIEVNKVGLMQDVARITRGVVREFRHEGIDFMSLNKPLPRFTMDDVLESSC
tara:strand:- start:622 stop:1479 length:858 start_codon:yes stop_codon:yes gene_type:complete